jgi:hypothetical protein
VSPIVEKKKAEKIEEDDSVVNDSPPAKKKLQLFNRKPDSDSMLNRAKIRFYDTDDEDEVPIKFVKPKELPESGNNSINQKKTLEKAKLERMLAGLAGTTSKDQIDSKSNSEPVVEAELKIETPVPPKPVSGEKKEEKHVSFVVDEGAQNRVTVENNLNQNQKTSLEKENAAASSVCSLAIPTNSIQVTSTAFSVAPMVSKIS